MSAPKVSIVIPTFNRSAMLRRCVDSALAQTFPCEVVVVDHGSSDDTPEVVRSFGSRVRYLRRAEDHGVHFAWVDGVVSALGEFVHLNFDDDFIEPTYVERCMALMGPQVGLCFCKVSLRNEATGRVESEFFGEFGVTATYPSRVFMDEHICGLVSPGAVILRRKDIINALFLGKVPFARCEYRGVGPDWLMTAMATLDYPKIGFVAEPLAIFSSHVGSITISALTDVEKRRAFLRAYREAKRLYALLRLSRTFRLDLLADVVVRCLIIKAKLISRLRRVLS